jgi:hypothetical protein
VKQPLAVFMLLKAREKPEVTLATAFSGSPLPQSSVHGTLEPRPPLRGFIGTVDVEEE